MCELNIDAFTLPPESKTNGASIFLYKKPSTYFLSKSVSYNNQVGLTINFTRLLDTGTPNDIKIYNTTNILYAVGGQMSNNYVSVHDYYDNFDVNFLTNSVVNIENDDNLKDYYLPIISGSIFLLSTLLGIVFTHIPNTFCGKSIKIFNMGYISNGTIIFATFYFLWWIGVCVYSFLSEDVDEIFARLGFWISLNLSVILFPVSRNNLSIILFNLSQEKIIHIHRFMSILCIISVLIKFIAVFIFYQPKILIENEYGDVNPLFGTISTISFFIIGCFSISIIRDKLFELFYYVHRIVSILIIVTASLHSEFVFFYILPSLFLYLLDLIIRYFKSNKIIFSKLQKFNKDDDCYVLLSLNSFKKIKTYPGCYFYINNNSDNQWHPISLVSLENDNLIFCFKIVGNWTKKICENTDKKFLIQGPYGFKYINYNKYKNIIFVAGGIGITPLFSIINDIYVKNNNIKLKLVWIINNIILVKIFKNYLLSLDKNNIVIDIYITKNINEIDMDFNLIQIGRPNISNVLTMSVVENYKDNAIFCCGPKSLTEEIYYYSTSNNIDLYCELFGK